MASSMEVKGNIFRIILLPILGIVLFCSNTGAEEQIHSLGISLLASEIENKYPVSALSDFIVHGGFTPVVIDWAWITYHWEKTDFEGVNRLLRILKEHNVKFAAMYRPRFLSVPTVPYQIKKDGSPAFSHGFEIRFTSPEARRWGWQW